MSVQTVALNSDQLREWGGGYPSAACGQTISIQYTSDSGVTSTKQATIQVGASRRGRQAEKPILLTRDAP